jgi:serine protease
VSGETCVSPFNVRTNQLTDTSASIYWDGFSDVYEVTISSPGFPDITVDVFDTDSLHLDTLTPCTDYTITVKANCGLTVSESSFPFYFTSDGCCRNPTVKSFTQTETSIEVEWEEILYATTYTLRYTEIDNEDWTELSDVESPVLIEGLAPCKDYQFQIYTLCGDSTRGFSESFIHRTKGCGACTELDYCSVSGANSANEWIKIVSLNGVTKETENDGGWLQSNQIITALTPEENYDITIGAGFSGLPFTEHYSVWIDFDQNGDFEGVNEKVVDNKFSTEPITESFDIPADALIGVTKMRIGMNGEFSPVICPTISFYGEYEDYCVYIGPQLGIEEQTMRLKVFPNPVNNLLNIEADEDISVVKIYSLSGQLILTQVDSTKTIDVSQLSNGTYLIEISSANQTLHSKFIKQ